MASGRTVRFSGRSWAVKASSTPVGPGPNIFSDRPENVWVDDIDRLHLRITSRDGCWHACEVILDSSLGHGSYGFSVYSPVGGLDANVVLGMFTWSDDQADSHREIDIEFARWAGAGAHNALYAVQPADRTGNVCSFHQPDEASTTHDFTWTPDRVSFRSDASDRPLARWQYSGADVPEPGDERARINLWLYRGSPPTDRREVEVVLSAFTFTPASR